MKNVNFMVTLCTVKTYVLKDFLMNARFAAVSKIIKCAPSELHCNQALNQLVLFSVSSLQQSFNSELYKYGAWHADVVLAGQNKTYKL